MKNNWRNCQLGEVLTFQRGFDITKKEQRDGPYQVFSSSGPKSTHADYKVKGPGVVIGRKGTLGSVFFTRDNYWPHDTTLWVKDFYGNDQKFAYYFTQTMGFEKLDVGAANPSLNRNHIHTIQVQYPPLLTQRKIAAILSAYDDLIENNLRRIKILEEMAQNLYREWFVKFRFPGHQHARFVDSPLGRIPEGWEAVTLGKLAIQIRDGVNPDSVDPETPYFGLEHLPRKSISLTEWGLACEVQSTKLLFKKNDILFGKIRPYFHKVGVAPLPGVCSSDTIVIRPRAADWFGLVLGCASSAEFVEHATATSQGTKMPRANWDILVNYQIPLPPQPILGQFNGFMSGIVNQLHNFVFRNQTLRRTRDLLLPRLISGEVDVSELDIAVPEEVSA